MSHSGYNSIRVKDSTLAKVRGHLLEQLVRSVNESGPMACTRLRPSVSKFVEEAIAEKLERDRFIATSALATSTTPEGVAQ